MIVRFHVPTRRSADHSTRSRFLVFRPNMRMKLPARGALQIRAAASACCEAYLKNTVPIGLLAGYGDCPPTLAFCVLCVGREAMAYQECSGNSSTRASAFHRLNGW
jgi:hypothetical protein